MPVKLTLSELSVTLATRWLTVTLLENSVSVSAVTVLVPNIGSLEASSVPVPLVSASLIPSLFCWKAVLLVRAA